MKTSTLFTTVFGLGLATAQNLSGQPACASPCLSSAITAAGCALADQGCQCGTGKASIQNLVATCLLSGCNPTDLAAAASVGNALCVAYSATATASTGGVLTIQTSTGPLTTTGSGLGTTTTTATTSLASTTGTSTTTSGSGSGSGTSAGGATTSPATTSPPSSSAATSGSGTGAEAGASSTSTAGAAQGVVAGAGGLVGLLLGLVAAL